MGTELELIEGLRQGDNESYKHLFGLYYNAICFVAGKLLKDYSESPEDYALHAFIKLYENRTNFYEMKKVKAFLFITAANRCKNFIRNKKRQATSLEGYSFICDHSHNPLSPQFNRQKAFTAIDKGMQSLSKHERQVTNLYYYSGFSNGQIAQQLNVTLLSVKKYKVRTLSKLRQVAQTVDTN